MDFLRKFYAGAMLAAAMTAGAQAEEVQSDAPSKAASAPVVEKCPAEKREGRVRADVLFSLEEDQTLSSTLYDLKSGKPVKTNLTTEELKGTRLSPASMTKLQSVMTMMRKISAGEWSRDMLFKIPLFFKEKPVVMTPAHVALASLNPSSNLLDRADFATQAFVDETNAYMKSKGMTGTTYMNLTGYPTTEKIRNGHKTTLYDQIIGIRDFELNYAVPERLQNAFGIDRITGLWRVKIPGIGSRTHTISVLETAEGKTAHPVQGIVSGKSGTTCNLGSGAYVIYRLDQTHRFGLLTVGHESAALRDRFIEAAIPAYKPLMIEFAQRASSVAPPSSLIPVSISHAPAAR